MPALPELLVLRHGETEWNREGRFQGALDSALTERGRAQAVALAETLTRLGVSSATHAALASPQGRAWETARIALSPLGLEPAPDRRLVEIDMGRWTGLLRSEILAGWPGPEGEPLLGLYGRCPDGEPLEGVAARVRAVLEAVRRPSVIVTHGVTLRILCALATGGGLAEAESVLVPQGSLARVAEGRLEVVSPRGGNLQDAGASPNPATAGG